MQNRLSIDKMDMLCFIYINSRFIRTATKQKDEEAERLAVLIADLLLNQEDDLVEYEAINDDDEDEWEDLEAFFDEVINLAPA
jgi:tryptophan synthase alpha subunit